MSNSIEDLIRDLINDALNEFKDDEIEGARRDAYDDTREVDYRVDNADSEIRDLKSEVIELERRLDSLEEVSND